MILSWSSTSVCKKWRKFTASGFLLHLIEKQYSFSVGGTSRCWNVVPCYSKLVQGPAVPWSFRNADSWNLPWTNCIWICVSTKSLTNPCTNMVSEALIYRIHIKTLSPLPNISFHEALLEMFAIYTSITSQLRRCFFERGCSVELSLQ